MATTPTSPGSTTQTNRVASAATPDLAADANTLIDEAKSVTGKVAEEVKDQAAGLADRAKEEIGAATDKVRSIAADQKDLIAAQVGGVAGAMDRAASDLEQNNGASAQYARMIADNAEKLSDTIRNNNVDELLGMAQDFGRKQPALFVGAAALLGFAASRFVLASAKRRDEQAVQANSSSTYQDYAGEPASSAANGPDSWTTGGA
jgi:ElaB/YqjD/DUF883 family membrane-anchored ribosome-binding protein